MTQLTHRQLQRLSKLPDDHTVVNVQQGSPVVRRPDGQFLRLQRSGRLVPTTLIERVQSYRRVRGD